ncbi:MAG: hypothetical protein KAS66_03875, partial [Candidatus Omnitrophica bacterium]|nr:hypothetical protein [Candidatus Omnitrophota bacterium]
MVEHVGGSLSKVYDASVAVKDTTVGIAVDAIGPENIEAAVATIGNFPQDAKTALLETVPEYWGPKLKGAMSTVSDFATGKNKFMVEHVGGSLSKVYDASVAVKDTTVGIAVGVKDAAVAANEAAKEGESLGRQTMAQSMKALHEQDPFRQHAFAKWSNELVGAPEGFVRTHLAPEAESDMEAVEEVLWTVPKKGVGDFAKWSNQWAAEHGIGAIDEKTGDLIGPVNNAINYWNENPLLTISVKKRDGSGFRNAAILDGNILATPVNFVKGVANGLQGTGYYLASPVGDALDYTRITDGEFGKQMRGFGLNKIYGLLNTDAEKYTFSNTEHVVGAGYSVLSVLGGTLITAPGKQAFTQVLKRGMAYSALATALETGAVYVSTGELLSLGEVSELFGRNLLPGVGAMGIVSQVGKIKTSGAASKFLDPRNSKFVQLLGKTPGVGNALLKTVEAHPILTGMVAAGTVGGTGTVAVKSAYVYSTEGRALTGGEVLDAFAGGATIATLPYTLPVVGKGINLYLKGLSAPVSKIPVVGKLATQYPLLTGSMVHATGSHLGSVLLDDQQYLEVLVNGRKEGYSDPQFSGMWAKKILLTSGRWTRQAFNDSDWFFMPKDEGTAVMLDQITKQEMRMGNTFLDKKIGGMTGNATSFLLNYGNMALATSTPSALVSFAMTPKSTIVSLGNVLKDILNSGGEGAQAARDVEIFGLAGSIFGGARGYKGYGSELSRLSQGMQTGRMARAVNFLADAHKQAGTATMVMPGISLGISLVKNRGDSDALMKTLGTMAYDSDNLVKSALGLTMSLKIINAVAGRAVSGFQNSKLGAIVENNPKTAGLTAVGGMATGAGMYYFGTSTDLAGTKTGNTIANIGTGLFGLSGLYLLGAYNARFGGKNLSTLKNVRNYAANAAVAIPSAGSLVYALKKSIVDPLSGVIMEVTEVTDSTILNEVNALRNAENFDEAKFKNEHGYAGQKIRFEHDDDGKVTKILVLKPATYAQASTPNIGFGFEKGKTIDAYQKVTKAVTAVDEKGEEVFTGERKIVWETAEKPVEGDWPYLLGMGSLVAFAGNTVREYKQNRLTLAFSKGAKEGLKEAFLAPARNNKAGFIKNTRTLSQASNLKQAAKVYAKVAGVPVATGTGLIVLSAFSDKIPYLENENTKNVLLATGLGLTVYGAARGAGVKLASIRKVSLTKMANVYATVKTGTDMALNTGSTLFIVIPGLHGVVEGTSKVFSDYVVPYTNTNWERALMKSSVAAFWDDLTAVKYKEASNLADVLKISWNAALFGLDEKTGKLKVNSAVDVLKNEGLPSVLGKVQGHNYVFASILGVGMQPIQGVLSNIKAMDMGRRFRAFGMGLEKSAGLGLDGLLTKQTGNVFSQGVKGGIKRSADMITKGMVEEVVVEQAVGIISAPVFALLGSIHPSLRVVMPTIEEIWQEVASPNGIAGPRTQANSFWNSLYQGNGFIKGVSFPQAKSSGAGGSNLVGKGFGAFQNTPELFSGLIALPKGTKITVETSEGGRVFERIFEVDSVSDWQKTFTVQSKRAEFGSQLNSGQIHPFELRNVLGEEEKGAATYTVVDRLQANEINVLMTTPLDADVVLVGDNGRSVTFKANELMPAVIERLGSDENLLNEVKSMGFVPGQQLSREFLTIPSKSDVPAVLGGSGGEVITLQVNDVTGSISSPQSSLIAANIADRRKEFHLTTLEALSSASSYLDAKLEDLNISVEEMEKDFIYQEAEARHAGGAAAFKEEVVSYKTQEVRLGVAELERLKSDVQNNMDSKKYQEHFLDGEKQKLQIKGVDQATISKKITALKTRMQKPENIQKAKEKEIGEIDKQLKALNNRLAKIESGAINLREVFYDNHVQGKQIDYILRNEIPSPGHTFPKTLFSGFTGTGSAAAQAFVDHVAAERSAGFGSLRTSEMTKDVFKNAYQDEDIGVLRAELGDNLFKLFTILDTMADKENVFNLAAALYNNRRQITGLHSEQLVALGQEIHRSRTSDAKLGELNQRLPQILNNVENMQVKGLPATYRVLGEERDISRIERTLKRAPGLINTDIQAIPVKGVTYALYDTTGGRILDIQKMDNLLDLHKNLAHESNHAVFKTLSSDEKEKVFELFNANEQAINKLRTSMLYFRMMEQGGKWREDLFNNLGIDLETMDPDTVFDVVDKIKPHVTAHEYMFGVITRPSHREITERMEAKGETREKAEQAVLESKNRDLIEESISVYQGFRALDSAKKMSESTTEDNYRVRNMYTPQLDREHKALQKLASIVGPALKRDTEVYAKLNDSLQTLERLEDAGGAIRADMINVSGDDGPKTSSPMMLAGVREKDAFQSQEATDRFSIPDFSRGEAGLSQVTSPPTAETSIGSYQELALSMTPPTLLSSGSPQTQKQPSRLLKSFADTDDQDQVRVSSPVKRSLMGSLKNKIVPVLLSGILMLPSTGEFSPADRTAVENLTPPNQYSLSIGERRNIEQVIIGEELGDRFTVSEREGQINIAFADISRFSAREQRIPAQEPIVLASAGHSLTPTGEQVTPAETRAQTAKTERVQLAKSEAPLQGQGNLHVGKGIDETTGFSGLSSRSIKDGAKQESSKRVTAVKLKAVSHENSLSSQTMRESGAQRDTLKIEIGKETVQQKEQMVVQQKEQALPVRQQEILFQMEQMGPSRTKIASVPKRFLDMTVPVDPCPAGSICAGGGLSFDTSTIVSGSSFAKDSGIESRDFSKTLFAGRETMTAGSPAEEGPMVRTADLRWNDVSQQSFGSEFPLMDASDDAVDIDVSAMRSLHKYAKAGILTEGASNASSPIKPREDSTETLDLFDPADSIIALEDRINELKPRQSIDNVYLDELFHERYGSTTFSDDRNENDRIVYENVKLDLTEDLRRMGAPDRAEDVLNRFLKGEQVKIDISDPELRVNNEIVGLYARTEPGDRQEFTGFVLPKKREVLAIEKIRGYELPSDAGVQTIFNFDPNSKIREHVTFKLDRNHYNRDITEYGGIDINMENVVVGGLSSGRRGALSMIFPDYAERYDFIRKNQAGIFEAKPLEIVTRNVSIATKRYYREVAEINQFVLQEDEKGAIKGLGLIHPHIIEAPGRIQKNKKMVADILQDKSVRNHLSPDFYKFARNVSQNTDIDVEESRTFLSSKDFLTLFTSTGFNVPGHRARALFSAIAEMDEFGDTITGVNVVDPTSTQMPDEEVDYRTGVARRVKKIIRKASENEIFEVEDPKERALIVEHYLGMKDISVRNTMPYYVNMARGKVPSPVTAQISFKDVKTSSPIRSYQRLALPGSSPSVAPELEQTGIVEPKEYSGIFSPAAPMPKGRSPPAIKTEAGSKKFEVSVPQAPLPISPVISSPIIPTITPVPVGGITPAVTSSPMLILGSKRTDATADRALLSKLRDVEVTHIEKRGTIRIRNTDTTKAKNVLGTEIAAGEAVEAFVVPTGNISHVVPFDSNERILTDINVGGVEFRAGDRVDLARAEGITTITVFDQNDLSRQKATLTMNPSYEAPARETVDTLEGFKSKFIDVQRIQQNPADSENPIVIVKVTEQLKTQIAQHLNGTQPISKVQTMDKTVLQKTLRSLQNVDNENLASIPMRHYEHIAEIRDVSFERTLGKANDYVAKNLVSMANNVATVDRFVNIKEIKPTDTKFSPYLETSKTVYQDLGDERITSDNRFSNVATERELLKSMLQPGDNSAQLIIAKDIGDIEKGYDAFLKREVASGEMTALDVDNFKRKLNERDLMATFDRETRTIFMPQTDNSREAIEHEVIALANAVTGRQKTDRETVAELSARYEALGRDTSVLTDRSQERTTLRQRASVTTDVIRSAPKFELTTAASGVKLHTLSVAEQAIRFGLSQPAPVVLPKGSLELAHSTELFGTIIKVQEDYEQPGGLLSSSLDGAVISSNKSLKQSAAEYISRNRWNDGWFAPGTRSGSLAGITEQRLDSYLVKQNIRFPKGFTQEKPFMEISNMEKFAEGSQGTVYLGSYSPRQGKLGRVVNKVLGSKEGRQERILVKIFDKVTGIIEKDIDELVTINQRLEQLGEPVVPMVKVETSEGIGVAMPLVEGVNVETVIHPRYNPEHNPDFSSKLIDRAERNLSRINEVSRGLVDYRRYSDPADSYNGQVTDNYENFILTNQGFMVNVDPIDVKRLVFLRNVEKIKREIDQLDPGAHDIPELKKELNILKTGQNL